jgi:hypothetical protein
MRRDSTIRTGAIAVACLAMATAGFAQQHLNFVTCPIVRDTASVPCWLAEYEGKTYFLTLQTDVSAEVTPPWLGHRVLVEGVVSTDSPICGGAVLKPVHLSVLERDPSCNTMLPAEERYNLTFEPPRPPGPSGGRLAFDNGRPAAPAAPAAKTRQFTVAYEFDGMVGFKHAQPLTEILNFARAVNASHIEIAGYRGAVRLSNGQTITEEAGIARKRAQQIEMLLRGANLTAPSYDVKWQDEPVAATGVDDYSSRRVVVTVHPR